MISKSIWDYPLTLILVLSLTATLRAAPPLAVPVDGRPFPAEIVAISGKGQIIISADGQTKTLPIADLVYWGAPLEPRHGPLIVFADGGLLSADVFAADKDRVDADSDLFGRMKLPLAKLSGILFRLPGTAQKLDGLFERLATATGDADRLLLDNGDELSGMVETIDDKAVNLQTEAGLVGVELSRVNAVIFNPQLKSKTLEVSPRTWLGFCEGSRLLAASFSPHPLGEGQGGRAEASLQFSIHDQSCKTPLKNLVFLQPLSGRAAYLSDLKPTEYRHVPHLSIEWPYRIDRNVEGHLLRAAGRLHLKGIGVHSAARLSYDLPGGVRRFQAEAAIDDAVSEGSVRFRVFVDRKEKFTSPPVRSGMMPLPIDVDLSGGKRLDLIVDFADRADVQDRADWLDARLIR